MRSRVLCRGKIPPRCVPGRQSGASFALHASRKGPRTGKSPVRGKIRAPCIRKRAGFGKICAPCIRNAPQIAVGGYTARRSCQEGPPFRCAGPSNHARREDLAIRRRTARAIATTAPPLWAVERGAGGFLSGGVTLPKECVVLWGVERWRQSWHQ